MDTKIQLTVRLYKELDSKIIRLFETNQEKIIHEGGDIYFSKGDKVYSCEYNPQNVSFLENLIGIKLFTTNQETEEKVWKEVLCGKAGKSDLERFGIQDNIPRCVVYFRQKQDAGEKIQREMIPLEPSDRIVEIKQGEVALILNMKERSYEETAEYAAAINETLENEGGVSFLAGIGRTADRSEKLIKSFSEAKAAVEIGIRHKIHGSVFTWEKLKLERLEDLIPDSDAKAFREELINPEADKILTNEILDTVHTFFQNDMNLSTTARQLFIHRNTLIYRMEKVRKATGLDLKKFDDAVVFRMMIK